MATARQHHHKQVTDGLAVTYNGAKVHLSIDRHIDEALEVYVSYGLLVSPAVARQLGEALIEMADHAAVPAAAS